MTYPVSAGVRDVVMNCCGCDHTIAERHSLARWSSIVYHTIVGVELSTMDAVDNAAGMFGLQIQAIDTACKQRCCTEGKVELHDSVSVTRYVGWKNTELDELKHGKS